MKQPNILLIMTDQLRGDCLGFARHPDVKTPYLDTLASRGISFDNAYSACPSCIAARAALHTGLSQEHHKRTGYEDGIIWDYPHTMAGELSKAGYYCQCVGKMHVHPLRNYLGFHNVELHDGYLHSARYTSVPWQESQKNADDYFHWLKQEKGIDADVTDTGLECNSWVARPWIYEEKYHPTNWVTDRSIDFLRRKDPQKPFFLMASYLRPHPPFDACITHLDHQIGRLIQALVEYGVYEDTLILFTSDHGEELCDHHMFRKSRPYQGSIRIPLILSGNDRLLPGLTPGTVSHSLVELRDVMPTLLDFVHTHIPDTLDGKSMLPLIEQPQKALREVLHGEHSYGEYSNHWLVTPQDKFIWYSETGTEQYFRLLDDPKELHNEIDNPVCQNRICQLRDCLIQTLKNRPEGFSDGTKLIPGQPYPPYMPS